VCAYSFATNEMRADKDTYIGYVEMALGVGDMVGPAIGGLMYNLFGFSGTFMGFSALIFIGIIFCIRMIPESLNYRSERLSPNDRSEESES
jgi:MFS family permease